MKLDKETFIKHQFWFLLGGFVLVWLIGLTSLSFSASEPIKTKKDAYDKAANDIKMASTQKGGPKNESFYKPWEEYGQKFIKHKDEIWEKAWKVQSEMFDWPSEKIAAVMYNLQSGQDDFPARRDFQGIDYPGQFTALKEQNITGPVEFVGGFDKVMDQADLKKVPTREECFLVQEDFWVRRDLLYVVAATDNAVAYMEVKPLDKKPEGMVAAYTLRNINWEVTLLIEKKGRNQQISERSTVKNIHPSHRLQHLANPATGSVVTIALGQGQWQTVPLVGEPLPFGGESKFLKKPVDLKIDLSDYKEKPFLAMQVFDWWSCPIKRINGIAIPYQSSRTVTTALKANDFLAKLDAPKEEPGAAENPAPGGAPGMPSMPGMPGGAPPGAGAGAGAGAGKAGGPAGPGAPGMGGMLGMRGGENNQTPINSIERNRYLQAPKGDKDEVEKPCRHMPFAMQVVMDQSHVEDFLVALANSRLRIQITQVEMAHVSGIKPESAGASPDEGDRPGPGPMPGPRPGGSPPQGPRGPGGPGYGSPPMMPGMIPGQIAGSMPGGPGGRGRNMLPGMMMPQMPMPRPGMMPGFPGFPGRPAKGGKDTTVLNPDDPNLVELTVYAITTLYRKPDEKKPEPAAQHKPGPGVPVPPAPGPGTNPAVPPPPGPNKGDTPPQGNPVQPAPAPEKKPTNPTPPAGK
jgi:hypothetical protein